MTAQPQWIDVPGGTMRMGLSAEQAQRVAEAAARRSRRQVDEDPDPLRGDREARELEEKWGNVDYLLEQLVSSQPAHSVEIAPFAIASLPVSVADWHEFQVAVGGAERETRRHGERNDEPVTGVSWADAVDFAAWRDAALPTEAQWERAARGVDGAALAWGDARWLGDQAAAGALIHAVGDYYEWCADEFAPFPGADRRACDRIQPPPGGWWGTRTRRGGALPGIPALTVTRRGADPSLRLRDTTFRLVKAP